MSRAKKIIIAVLILAVIVLVFIFVRKQLNSGTLFVEVKGSGVLISIHDSKGKEIAQKQSDSLKKQLPKGIYEISASNNNGGMSAKEAEIKPGQETKVSLEIDDIVTPKRLVDFPASDISPYQKGLYFIQANSLALKKYNFYSASVENTNVNLDTLSDIGLDKSGNGYALTSNDLIYKISGGEAKNIRGNILSGIDNLDRPRDISYNTKNKKLYISAGNKIYLSSGGQKASEIYKTPWKIAKIYYSGGEWMLISELIEERTEEYGEPTNKAISVALLNTSSKEFIDLGKTTFIQSASWTSDGSMLAYTDGGNTFVYDINSRKIVTRIPLSPDSVSYSSWCSNKKILFSDSTGLWEYSVDKNDYKKLVSSLKNIRTLYCEKSDMFLGTFDYPRSGGLYQIPSNNDASDSLYLTLNDNLPYNGDGYTIEYSVSINKPVIKIDIQVPRNISFKKKGEPGYLAHNIFINSKKRQAIDYLYNLGINQKNSKFIFKEIST